MDWASEVAAECGCSKNWIYMLSRKLGRRATPRDVEISRNKPKGRPVKYKY